MIRPSNCLIILCASEQVIEVYYKYKSVELVLSSCGEPRLASFPCSSSAVARKLDTTQNHRLPISASFHNGFRIPLWIIITSEVAV